MEQERKRPFELLIRFDQPATSLVTGQNGALIPDHSLQSASHAIFDNRCLETAPGRTALGTQLESGAAIDGLFRSWDKAGNQDAICVCNGKIKYWTGSAWSDLQTGLTVGTPYDFLNHKDSTYIVNGYDDAYQFFPRTNTIQKAGLEPPRFYKKVAYFETDETTTGDGQSNDTVTFDIAERTGNCARSLKVTAGAGQSKYGRVTFASAQDFSVYPNGASISNDDYFCISIFHRELAYINYLTIAFATDSSNWYQANIESTDLDPILQRNNQWTRVLIKKSAFASSGTPNWASIAYVNFWLYAQTGSTSVNFDNCYWKNTPIQAYGFGKVIDNFDGPTSDWTAGSGSLTFSNNWRYVKTIPGNSLKITHTTQSGYKAVSLDLTKHQDGVTSQTSDEICLWVKISSTQYLTNIILRLYSDTATPKYFHYTYTGFKASTSPTWNEIRIKKSAFSDQGGASWAAITRIYIALTTTEAVQCYFDDWTLQELKTQKELATMATTESWTWSPTGTGNFNTDPRFIAYPNTANPSSIFMKVPCKNIYYSQLDWSTKDLTIFGASETSGTDDVICFWMYWTVFKSISKIKLMIDVNSLDFATDYYFYEMWKADIRALRWLKNPTSVEENNCAVFVEIKKSDFTRVGTTGGKSWATSEGVRFEVSTIDKAGDPVKIYFDDLHMRRRFGMTGLYQWCCVFADDNDVFSAPSEWSAQLELSGTRALLKNLPLSQDSRVTKRLFYRKGGDLGDVAMLDFILYDNTTTTYFTDTQDYELSSVLDTDERIPNGTIRVPLASKWGGLFKGRAILYRDPLNLRRLYYSKRDYLYAWSELQAWDMPSDITDVWVDDDILYINTKLGIKRLSVDLADANSESFEETGIVKASISPWASAQCEELRGYVSFDGLYLFNGYRHDYISEHVKTFFDSATYDLDAVKVAYRKRHLFVSVKTTGGVRSLVDFYLPERKVRTSDYSINCFAVFDGPSDNLELYGGSLDGYVYQLDTSVATAMSVRTKDYEVSKNIFEESVLEEIWVKAKSDSSTPGAVTIQCYIDQILVSGLTLSFPPVGNLIPTMKSYPTQLMGVQNLLKGSKVGLLISQGTQSKKIEIEGILLRGSIAELPKTYEET